MFLLPPSRSIVIHHVCWCVCIRSLVCSLTSCQQLHWLAGGLWAGEGRACGTWWAINSTMHCEHIVEVCVFKSMFLVCIPFPNVNSHISLAILISLLHVPPSLSQSSIKQLLTQLIHILPLGLTKIQVKADYC